VEQNQALPEEVLSTGEDTRWLAVEARDASMDGVIFYGVRSTGIYCKPSCPARRARRNQVTFFDSRREAESAGFRPCRRCRPHLAGERNAQLYLVERACQLIEASGSGPASLTELSVHLGVSQYHLQRTFKRVVGLTPRQYALAHRVKQFKTRVRAGATVAGAMYDAGFGSSSRLYEKSDAELGMTPASYAHDGAGTRISFTITECELGHLLVAATERGLCAVRLGDSEEELEGTLREEFSKAEIARDPEALGLYVKNILGRLAGQQVCTKLPLDVRATAFQRRVWSYLQSIPCGEVQSYGDVAAGINQPSAVRAVARACASNSVAVVIPCHRVIRGDGELGGYRWGLKRKRALIDSERVAVRRQRRS
jgi:AraC family transcriptional regulator, regulatory protein of adaptative response / methylated-DNA-[protein]-cysteine methyltransferase